MAVMSVSDLEAVYIIDSSSLASLGGTGVMITEDTYRVVGRGIFSSIGRDMVSIRALAKQSPIPALGDRTSIYELKRYYRMFLGESIDIESLDESCAERIFDSINEALQLYEKQGILYLHALNGVNLEIEKNKIVAVVGESGAGKSTLALLMLGLVPYNARVLNGEVLFRNKNILENEVLARTYRARYMGYIGQGSYTYLNPMLENAYQVLESSLLRSDSQDEAIKLFMRAIKEARIDTRLMLTYPHKLSGGEIRRVAFAMALAKEPEILICDEPFRNIDIYHAQILASFLRELAEKFRVATAIFTHNLAIMAHTADEIAVMYHGIIVEKGPTKEIFLHPKHPYTKGLIGALPDPRNPKKKLIWVPGEPLPRFIKPHFCPFFNRCPMVSEQCLSGIPELKYVDGSLVACYRAQETADIPPLTFWGKICKG